MYMERLFVPYPNFEMHVSKTSQKLNFVLVHPAKESIYLNLDYGLSADREGAHSFVEGNLPATNSVP